MDNNFAKWLFIVMGAVIIVPTTASVIGDINRTNAKRDIIVACYNAGNAQCDQLWNKAIP